ncbi:hypothetical protein ARMSODRAFT_538495 [Armillaria solidipes]|uniref:Uncharacterized protein n=1 Tax=Armillaria solidipes TaxID=1076256 RepID=A0A2H3AXY1_9AGAR|nr:hypothetical protein ARMSODRAFT_538495 [Armillaria solidipes]
MILSLCTSYSVALTSRSRTTPRFSRRTTFATQTDTLLWMLEAAIGTGLSFPAGEGRLSNLRGDANRDSRKSVPLRERVLVSVVFVLSDRHIVAVEFLSSSLLY